MWALGTTFGILAFMAFFVGLAIWAFQSDVELVYDNYYEKDVVYEQQIRRIERTEALAVKPEIRYYRADETIHLVFPASLGHAAPQGELLLFRPSDKDKDRRFELALETDTMQVFRVPGLERGLWRAKLNWSSNDLEFYLEEPIMVH